MSRKQKRKRRVGRPSGEGTAEQSLLLSYETLRTIRLFLQGASARGLRLFCDDQWGWYWYWADLKRKSDQPFADMAEALLDALAFKYPVLVGNPPLVWDQTPTPLVWW